MRYILDPADLTERELEDILDLWEAVDDPLDPEAYARRSFPGETFRVLRESFAATASTAPAASSSKPGRGCSAAAAW